MKLFVTGIGTNVGKTLVSAILTEALQADYWKPIQSGTIEGQDALTVERLISNPKSKIHPESYLLKEPLSPHYAAKIEGVEIQLNKMEIPKTSNYLIIEGAGGVLVPLNQNDFVIQIAQQCNAEVVLVIQNYLGCINHSLLSINYLLTNGYKLKYLVFNGDFEDEVKQIILANVNKVKHIGIPYLKQVNQQFIKDLATEFKQVLS